MTRPLTGVSKPLTVAGSIIGVKYDSGIILASDTVLTFAGSLKFSGVTHFQQLTPSVVIGASGEFGDFQGLLDILKRPIRLTTCQTFGQHLAASEILSLIARILYIHRSRLQPFVVTVIVAGISPDQSSFLGVADLYGNSWVGDFACSGAAIHIRGLQLEGAVKKSKDEVIAAIKNVWAGLAKRHTLTSSTMELLDVSPKGIQALPPQKVQLEWSYCEATKYENEVDC
jgi:20S proteasome subunit beta 7